VKSDTAPLLRSAEQIDGEADMEELTASSEAAAETGATLATRQADALEAASQELLCSPEITRCHILAGFAISKSVEVDGSWRSKGSSDSTIQHSWSMNAGLPTDSLSGKFQIGLFHSKLFYVSWWHGHLCRE